MFTPPRLLLLCLALLLIPPLGGCGSSSDPDGGALPVEQGAFRLLVFSRTDGFRHASIEIGVEAVRRLGDQFGFDVDHTEDPADFSGDNLSRYAAVLWLNTTGNVLNEAQQVAFEQYIAAGGGLPGCTRRPIPASTGPSMANWSVRISRITPFFLWGPKVARGCSKATCVWRPLNIHQPRTCLIHG